MPIPDRTPATDRLREALGRDAANASAASVDLDEVLARSASARRRRRSAIAGGAAAAVVALAAGGFALSAWLGGPSASTTAEAPASSLAEESHEQADASAGSGPVAPADQPPFASDLALAPVDRLNACGAEPVAAEPVPGLELRVAAPAGLEAGGRGTAVVTLTNTSGRPYSGELLSGPAVTVADTVTRWHTSGLEIVRTPLELAPGASASFEAEVVAVRCEPADEAAPALPDGLPALSPGRYRLSAAVSLADQEAIGGVTLVSPAVDLSVG